MGGGMILDKKGVFSLYDAVLFFVFLIIASSILTVYSGSRVGTLQERSYTRDYCEHTRSAILSSTIPDTGYYDTYGFVNRTDMTVRGLLIEQVYLESFGVARENFTYADDISQMVDAHIEDRYDWFLQTSTNLSEDMVISKRGLEENIDLKSRLGDDVVSSSWYEEGLREEKIIITLYLTK